MIILKTLVLILMTVRITLVTAGPSMVLPSALNHARGMVVAVDHATLDAPAEYHA